MGLGREPERTCVGCRGKGSKHELLRIVRSSDGLALLDPSGTAVGRGAYLHRDGSCVRLALKSGSLVRALRLDLGLDGAARLEADIEREVRR